MALDTLTSMSVFRQTVEKGTIAAAARFLGISAEMAGHHLRGLETRLGVRLMNRTTRRLHVTEAGEAYYRRCVAVLEEVALADAEAGQRQTSPSGMIRIAAPLAFGTALLEEPIAAFCEQNPAVSIEIDLSERNVSLIDEGFDMAVRLGELQDSGLVARTLTSFPLIPIASPEYLRLQPAISHPYDLSNHEVLLYNQTSNPRIWRFHDAEGVPLDVTVRGRISASDIEFLLRLALRGRGLLLAPSFVASVHLSSGSLIPILEDWAVRSLQLNLVLPHRTLVPAAVRCFADFIADWFRSAPV